ncbi:odorant receptor 131-2-like [Morone saxatilis]|uniref:odorant receptor 131-2-like n=1 Tax=Morone saxatilis TaxID=34816 RepID=UPI0015E20144|nr:odorant receptor 131-2-like [Morone saxatilis]
MADNNSSVGGEVSPRQINEKIIIVQILVMIFLCINFLLIVTFFRKDCFYTTARYILFAVTLLSDSFILLMSNILLILAHFEFTIQVWLCIIISVVVLLYVIVTPVTLTAMTLERYVAICMPLQHAELCSTWKGLKTVILHGFQLLLCLIQLWCPLIEAAVFQIDLILFINVRYFNYIMFSLTPRCLSPLIYGLRDETFFHALKNYFLFGL